MTQPVSTANVSVRPSDVLWQKGGPYYTTSAGELLRNPLLPQLQCLFHRRVAQLFDRAGAAPGAHVIEAGCGGSRWLPYLGSRGCVVSGIEIEPFAAELARANLEGAGVSGTIYCRDAFAIQELKDLEGRFDVVYSMGVIEHFADAADKLSILRKLLKPGGRILTSVPNLQGVNGLLQKLVDRERFEMHVLYDAHRLMSVHELAGFKTMTRGYTGFIEGILTAPGPNARRLRRTVHAGLCRALHLSGEAWSRLAGDGLCPDLSWLAPHVFYVGVRT